jgi:hypothetical protein
MSSRPQHPGLRHLRGGDFATLSPPPGGDRGSFETPLARRTPGAQHRNTERAWWSIKPSTKQMTDHVAEQIEMKFKAATVSQPPH